MIRYIRKLQERQLTKYTTRQKPKYHKSFIHDQSVVLWISITLCPLTLSGRTMPKGIVAHWPNDAKMKKSNVMEYNKAPLVQHYYISGKRLKLLSVYFYHP
jgi:hypothetical protein